MGKGEGQPAGGLREVPAGLGESSAEAQGGEGEAGRHGGEEEDHRNKRKLKGCRPTASDSGGESTRGPTPAGVGETYPEPTRRRHRTQPQWESAKGGR